MTKIGLLSDTHGWVNPNIYEFFKDCDEIWHAGDIGNDDVAIELAAFKKLRAVYGNIDDWGIRTDFPQFQIFNIEDIKVVMTHIGGYPGKYNPWLLPMFKKETPQLFVCGHSHILKVQYDPTWQMLTMNPGAAGKQGWQIVQTLLRFVIDGNELRDLEVIELDRK